MRCCIVVLLLLLSSCATKVQAPDPDKQRMYVVPEGARDVDLICLVPESGPIMSQCLTVARFKIATNSIMANP